MRSLAWATDLDVLSVDRVIERRDGYQLVRSPGNPVFRRGNLQLYEDAPVAGDRDRWEALFAREFADEPRIAHRTFAWDRIDGQLGEAHPEFLACGYDLVVSAGLVARAEQIRPHPRANRSVAVRPLDPAGGGADEPLWEQVFEQQCAWNDEHDTEDAHRAFTRRRQDELRAHFQRGHGAWYVALDGDGEEVVGSCGVVAIGGRGRFQSVQTAPGHRRRGVCSRLVVDAAAMTATRYGARRFVIVADPAYHALGLYESLGFQQAERVSGGCRRASREL